MMTTQQQPSLDSPAVEQAPMVERVVNGARKVHEKRSIFWPVIFSYVISVLAGFTVAYLVNKVFGSPYNEGLLQFDNSLWRLGIPLSLVTAFLLGLVLPILFAKNRRLRTMFYTVLFQFITLVVLVITGLSQLSNF